MTQLTPSPACSPLKRTILRRSSIAPWPASIAASSTLRADYKTLQQSLTNSFQVAYGLGEIAWRQHDTNEAIRNYKLYLANANTNTAEATNVMQRLRELKGHSP